MNYRLLNFDGIDIDIISEIDINVNDLIAVENENNILSPDSIVKKEIVVLKKKFIINDQNIATRINDCAASVLIRALFQSTMRTIPIISKQNPAYS